MLLKERDWSDPLENLDRKFNEHYDVATADKFHGARSDFLREWHFLEIIWGRLQADLRAFYEATKENSRHNVRLVMYSFTCI